MKLSDFPAARALAVISLLGAPGCATKAQEQSVILTENGATEYDPSLTENTSTQVEVVLNEATAPVSARLQNYMASNPEVAGELQAGINYFREAENQENRAGTNQRTPAEFEALLSQLNASLRIPNSAAVIRQIESRHPEVITSFERRLEIGQNGIYLDGFNKHVFLIQRTHQGLEALRQIDVTTGANGFSNVDGSGGTPLGEQTIRSTRSGQLGEVVSYTSEHGCEVGNLLDTVQKGQGGPACITSLYFAIDHGRGIGFHGTNYERDRDGNLYMNRAVSGACIRMFNADGAALKQHFYDGMPVYIVGPENRRPSTPSRTSPTVESAASPVEPEIIIEPLQTPVISSTQTTTLSPSNTAPEEGINF